MNLYQQAKAAPSDSSKHKNHINLGAGLSANF